MPAKRPDSDRDYVIQLYLSGLSCALVAKQVGCSYDWALDVVREAGVVRSFADARAYFFERGGTVHNRNVSIPADVISQRYLSGETMKGLGFAFGVDANVIQRILRENGTTLRTMTEAYGLMDREKASALQAQGRSRLVGWGEELIHNWLVERGEVPDDQRPEGTRSIDIAIYPVAVEIVNGSSFPFNDPYQRGRIEELSKRGWNTCHVFISRRTRTLIPIVADQIVAFANFTRAQPSAFREHRVIRGCGELAAVASDNFDDVAIIPPSMNCPYHSCINKGLTR